MIKEMGINIIYGVASDIVYDVVKYVGTVALRKKLIGIRTKRQIEEYIRKNIPEEFTSLADSGVFEAYINSPQLLDAINAYIVYKTLGVREEKAEQMKSRKSASKKTLSLEELLDYLTNNLLSLYERNGIITMPDKRTVSGFFRFIVESAEKVIFNMLDSDNKSALFLQNAHFDFVVEEVNDSIKNLQDTIQRIIKLEVEEKKPDYEEIKKEYYNILKSRNSEAHIYLLDKFPFEKFYVPPVLVQDIEGLDPEKPFSAAMKRALFDYNYNNTENSWKDIFVNRNIIYITGGAGYGKSLFTKKIINDYNELNIFHSDEYLVIYGELKSFYVNNSESPISVVEFLQNSMKTSTLMDETKISREFIEYYLKIGRCIILLDALDEVEKNKREQLHEAVISFFKFQNPNNKICITSRNRGFIPEKDIEVLSISPLDERQIEKYVDKIIALGKFEKSEKAAFMEQTKILIEKGFLNSFLVLSLLINIYKAELELPENKLELYQKCFEYIANKREKDKTENRYDWRVISHLMKDNTFMELSELCFPNNTAVDKQTIENTLLRIYKSKYKSEVETENAIDEFLKFCSDRTELFVAAAEEDKFKFFHRSFFEYFYSQYIFLRCRDENEIIEKLLQFDVDSEVFELTIAMLKQKSEDKYQRVIETMLRAASCEFKERKTFTFFNMLILSMQVVDDALYREQFLNILTENAADIVKYASEFHNIRLVGDMYREDEDACSKICSAYYDMAMRIILDNCVRVIRAEEQIMKSKENDSEISADTLSKFDYVSIKRRLIFESVHRGDKFYLSLFVDKMDIDAEITAIGDDDIKRIFSSVSTRTKTRKINQIKEAIERYKEISGERKDKIKKLIVNM